ncbi:MAG: hypothetical protein V4550_14105 [Gemmatimonadota bacterium]
MIRRMSVLAVSCAMIGCSVTTTERVVDVPSAETFAGTWRSVTPSLEFIQLSVSPKSSEMGVLAARLTFSGVAWEGAGRIDGDSLVAGMSISGVVASSGVMVARARDAQTLVLQLRPSTAAALDLTLVRQ